MEGESTALLSGDTETKWYSSADPLSPAQRVLVSWHDLSVFARTKGKKKKCIILDGVGGEARPGRLLAVMGASGAGKSTLLAALAGRLGKNYATSGAVSYNALKEKHARL